MTAPVVFTFNVDRFRQFYPEFNNQVTYPDMWLQMQWDIATDFMSPINLGLINGASRYHALNLLTAHLAKRASIVAQGDIPLIETSATVDKVSVTTLPPPVKDAFDWWLDGTTYGAEFLALLQVIGVGGLIVGALPERSAIRNVDSIFPGSIVPGVSYRGVP